MSPRIIPISLSGDLRKAQAKGIRYADGLHRTYLRKSKLIRIAAEERLREVDKLECEAFNATIWAWANSEALRPANLDETEANPTIGKAINGGYDLLEAKCSRCRRVSLVPLRAVQRPADSLIWKPEAALFCEPCSEKQIGGRHQRAHILGLTYARPDPETPAKARDRS